MDRRERERLLTSSSSHFFFFFFFFSLVLCVYKCAPPRYQLSLSLSVQRERTFVNINPKLIFALKTASRQLSQILLLSPAYNAHVHINSKQSERKKKKKKKKNREPRRRCVVVVVVVVVLLSLSLQRVSAFIIKERRKNTKHTLTHASEQK